MKTPRQLRAELKARTKALRAKVEQNPFVQEARRKQRNRRIVWLLLLLLLLLFIRCECGPEAPPPVPDVADAGEPLPKPVPPKKPAPKKPLAQKMAPQPRGDFEGAPPGAPPWLDDFRMQVSARSTRLADCFTGTERPGALRWTTAVNPDNGQVSDHTLEPLGGTSDLSTDQRDCLLKVLSQPPYKIPKQAAAAGLPSRVGIAIEF